MFAVSARESFLVARVHWSIVPFARASTAAKTCYNTHHGSQKLATHPLWLTKIKDTPIAAQRCFSRWQLWQSGQPAVVAPVLDAGQAAHAEGEVVSSSVKAERMWQPHRQYEDRSWCRIPPPNTQRVSCEYFLRQATKAITKRLAIHR